LIILIYAGELEMIKAKYPVILEDVLIDGCKELV